MKNIRKLALETLLRINYDGAYSNLEIKKTLQRFAIKDEDRRLYLNIVYGCLQNQIYLDYLIKQQSSRPVNKLHKEVSEILRIAIYQLYFWIRSLIMRLLMNRLIWLQKFSPRLKALSMVCYETLCEKLRKMEKNSNLRIGIMRKKLYRHAIRCRYGLSINIMKFMGRRKPKQLFRC